MRRPNRLVRLVAVLGILFGMLMVSASVHAETVGGERKFIRNTDAVVSRDGLRLAYVRDSGTGKNVWVLDLATGVSAPVAKEDVNESSPIWMSSDTLTYTVEGDPASSFQVTLPDGQTLGTEGFRPVVSPDGVRTAYYDAGYIWVREDGVDSDLNVRGSKKAHSSYPTYVWSPDGSKLAFKGTEWAGDIPVDSVFVSNLDGSNAQRVYPSPLAPLEPIFATVQSFSWAPTSDQLVVSVLGRARELGQINVVSADGSAIFYTQNFGIDVHWGPNGQIAFLGTGGVSLMYQNDMMPTVLTSGMGVNDWSPDGTQLYFTRSNRAGTEIWVYDMLIGDERRLVR